MNSDIRILFELQDTALLQSRVSGFALGHFSITGSAGQASTLQCGPDRGLTMIVVDATAWLDAVRKVLVESNVEFSCVQAPLSIRLVRVRSGGVAIMHGHRMIEPVVSWSNLANISVAAARALVAQGFTAVGNVDSSVAAWLDLRDAIAALQKQL